MIGLANRMKQMAGRLPGASLSLAATAIVLWFAPALSSWCEWDRSLPWQLWRWLTGHFCHWSAEHLIWDVVVFLFLGAWCERHSRRQFLICTVAAAGAICVATALFLPEIQSYRGLSGLDSALFGWLSVELLRSAKAKKDWRTVSVVLLFALAFTAKVALECVTASTLFVSNSQSGFVPVPLAHAVGIVAGICSNLFSRTPRLGRNDAINFWVERATGPFCGATSPTAVRSTRRQVAAENGQVGRSTQTNCIVTAKMCPRA